MEERGHVGYDFDVKPDLTSRRATRADAVEIARIYNEGIEDRVATFETAPRSEADVLQWFERPHPIVVVEEERRIVAFASTSPSSGRCCYAGNADFSVYVERTMRGRGAGVVAMVGLLSAARDAGLTKLLSGVFPENSASRALLKKLGFREVGTYERHGQLEGAWRDVVIVERLL
jgi:L-amino acid N-acyltransferase YncA